MASEVKAKLRGRRGLKENDKDNLLNSSADSLDARQDTEESKPEATDDEPTTSDRDQNSGDKTKNIATTPNTATTQNTTQNNTQNKNQQETNKEMPTGENSNPKPITDAARIKSLTTQLRKVRTDNEALTAKAERYWTLLDEKKPRKNPA